VLQPGVVNPNDTLQLHKAANHAPTLHQAMTLWRAHPPLLDQLSALAEVTGIAKVWQDKIRQRVSYLLRSGSSA
jgi:MOSC domain-containing protein YiiM